MGAVSTVTGSAPLRGWALSFRKAVHDQRIGMFDKAADQLFRNIRRGSDGEMVVEKRPIAPLPDELKSVIEEMK